MKLNPYLAFDGRCREAFAFLPTRDAMILEATESR